MKKCPVLIAVLLILGLVFSWMISAEAEDSLAVGDIVTFGRFEQDADEGNGPEEIEWIVLDLQGGNATLLSRRVLAAMPYNEGMKESATWESSSLRAWLNNEFKNAAFSAGEQALLNTVTVPAPEKRTLNAKVKPGNDTQDQVYLLSYDDCEQYFFKSKQLLAGPASESVSRSFHADKDGSTEWWLRSYSKSNTGAHCVQAGGDLKWEQTAMYVNRGVRPVIEISEARIDPAWVKSSEYNDLLKNAASAAAAEAQYEEDRDSIRNMIREYYYSGMDELPGQPVATGKLVFGIWTENGSYNDSLSELKYNGHFYDVPDELLAKSLSEADTFVIIYAENLQVGYYSGPERSAAAYRTTTYAVVVDMHRNAAYRKWEAAVDDPPEKADISSMTLAVSGHMDIEGAIRQVMEKYQK